MKAGKQFKRILFPLLNSANPLSVAGSRPNRRQTWSDWSSKEWGKLPFQLVNLLVKRLGDGANDVNMI